MSECLQLFAGMRGFNIPLRLSLTESTFSGFRRYPIDIRANAAELQRSWQRIPHSALAHRPVTSAQVEAIGAHFAGNPQQQRLMYIGRHDSRLLSYPFDRVEHVGQLFAKALQNPFALRAAADLPEFGHSHQREPVAGTLDKRIELLLFGVLSRQIFIRSLEANDVEQPCGFSGIQNPRKPPNTRTSVDAAIANPTRKTLRQIWDFVSMILNPSILVEFEKVRELGPMFR